MKKGNAAFLVYVFLYNFSFLKHPTPRFFFALSCNPLVPLGVKGQMKNTTTQNISVSAAKKKQVEIILFNFSIKFASFSHFL